jgi:alpha-glucosidase
VIHGRIGEHVTIARRRGEEWYVGTLNAGSRRRLEIPLDFLEAGTAFRAYVYEDDEPGRHEIRDAEVRDLDVDSTSTLTADLSTSGGQAVRLAPVR